MDWRLNMLQFCGPGVLSGILLGDWLRLLRQNAGQVDFSKAPRICTITIQSLKNTIVGRIERRRFGAVIESTTVQPPVFILGHWRSGTTLLHELLCVDDRFAYPTSYQTAFPHIFLTFEAFDSRLMKPFMPARRPMDNMGLSLDSPQEDEFALCSASLKSSCMEWVFPRQKNKFRPYLTMNGVDPAELEVWRKAFLTFAKKLQWRYGRPLLLKSPQHTARIRHLLQLFPEAKFVHIHRHPFRVFQSTRRTIHIMFEWHGLQRPGPDSLDDWVVDQYREMYDAFFEQQSLIAPGRFYELAFEELERDPVDQVRRLYQALDLPAFSQVEPKLRTYVDSLKGYRKNEFSDLPDALQKRLRHEWHRSFEAWGYGAEETPR